MKKTIALIAGLVVGMSSASATTVLVFPSISPNLNAATPGSDPYLVNAVFAIENGLSSFIGGGDPLAAQYTQTNTVNPGDVIVTSFESWRGEAPPPAGFENEFGNHLLFGTWIQSDTAFTLSDILYEEDFFGFLDSFTLAGQQFNFDMVGVNYGGNGVLGGGDDTRFDTPGGATDDDQLIHELYFAGFGNAFFASDAQGLADAKAYVASFYGVPGAATGSYTLQGMTGTGSVAVIPEPSTFGILALGLSALCVLRRRRKA